LIAAAAHLYDSPLAAGAADADAAAEEIGGDGTDGSRLARLAVVSGGTGFNETARWLASMNPNVTHIMPISDNGGSSAEIIRVLRGPAIGDIRSRLLRLASEETPQLRLVKKLLMHRLPSDAVQARDEWASILDGSHELWRGMEKEFRSTIRAFLVEFSHEVLRRGEKKFDYREGSVGNFFFSGARLFFQSIEGAIFTFSKLAGIHPSTRVVPVISTHKRVNIGARLMDGSVILGQQSISHPSPLSVDPDAGDDKGHAVEGVATSSATLLSAPPSSFEARRFDKEHQEPLPSPIDSIFYCNEDFQRIEPRANPQALVALREADHIVFSMGSLFTSIVPCVILPGVAEALRANRRGRKVLILNGWFDRETEGLGAVDMVRSLVRAVQRYPPRQPSEARADESFSDFVDTLVAPRDGPIPVDEEALRRRGVHVVWIDSTIRDGPRGQPRALYDEKALARFLARLPRARSVRQSADGGAGIERSP
jgi:2-phospho-L-lactate transferase/gluconeogenesis factor (CofD/UPF0052 family)